MKVAVGFRRVAAGKRTSGRCPTQIAVTQEFVVEVFFMTPAKRIPNPAFRNETMDMGIPFQVPAKGMKDTDKPRSKEFGFVIFMEHTRDNTVNGREKAI